jgi:hypothetical protein
VSSAQNLFVLPELSLGGDAVGDVDGVPEYVGRPVRRSRQYVSVHPDVRIARSRDDAHQAGVVPVLLDSLQVVVEKVALVRGEELTKVPADAVFRPIAERPGRRRIDGRDRAG